MRRSYYLVVRIHKDTDRPGSADGEVVAHAIKRSRWGIFCVNEWRKIAEGIVSSLGYELGSPFGYHDRREWNFTSFIYGSSSKDGNGRCQSQLWRIPTKLKQ